MTFRDQVLNLPRAGLSLAEGKIRHGRLAGLPPELFELAELQAGKGASFVDKLKAFVTALQTLVVEVQKAEAAAPAAKSTQVPAKGTTSAAIQEGAKASEALRPDQALAAAADALMLSENFTGDYGAALGKVLADDLALARRYREDNFGRPDTTPRAARADVMLAERAKKLAEERSIPYGEAMSRALAEDPALAERYKGA